MGCDIKRTHIQLKFPSTLIKDCTDAFVGKPPHDLFILWRPGKNHCRQTGISWPYSQRQTNFLLLHNVNDLGSMFVHLTRINVLLMSKILWH